MGEIHLDRDAEALLKRLLRDYEIQLRRQALLVCRETWVRNGYSGDFCADVLRVATGVEAPWKTVMTQGQSAVELLRRINDSAHVTTTTSGAAAMRPLVAEVQGGAHCVLCGETETLEVDHIIPVNMGGSDHLRNLQLLCKQCNSAKKNLKDDLLAVTLQSRLDRVVTDTRRYKRLQLSTVEHNGREFGRCSCGRRAGETRLRVVVKSPMSASFINLQVVCHDCEQGHYEHT